MRYSHSLLLLALVFLSFSAFAQKKNIKFGDISEEELKMEVYEADSSASSVILSDIGNTRFTYNANSGIRLEFTRHTRIKVLSKDGYDWANVEIPLYHDGRDKEALSGLKGYTYNYEDGKLKKEKLKNNSEFTEKYSDHYDIVKFTMPAVKVGTVLEYEYTISSDFLFNLQDWEFQKSIPVIWSEYKVAIPEYFIYKQFQRGYHALSIHETEQKSGSFHITSKSRSGGNSFYDGSTKTEYSNETLNFLVNSERWVAENVPALVEEPYITTMNDYVTKVNFELASIQFPGETIKIYTRTWEDIDKELLDDEDFGGIIETKGAVKKEAEQITAGETEVLKKLAIIYTYMSDQVKWNGEKRLFGSQSGKYTLEEKSGNSADINLTLIAMLRAAGIDAQPLALSTREHGMLITSFPMLNQYNYVIAKVDIDGNSILLDATEKNCPYNLLPVHCLNGMGRVINKEVSDKWFDLNETQPSDSRMLVIADVSLNEAHQIEASISTSAKDYHALQLRKKYHHKNEDRISDLEKVNAGWDIKNYETNTWEDVYQPIEEKIEITSSGGVMEAGDLIYFNPILSDKIEENPFKLINRTYPVDYAHTNSQMYMMNFKLPAGYQLEEKPDEIVITLPNNAARFTYQVKEVGHIVQVVNKLEINKSRFYAQEYPNLREFYNLIVAKQAEQLVLRKLEKSEQ